MDQIGSRISSKLISERPWLQVHMHGTHLEDSNFQFYSCDTWLQSGVSNNSQSDIPLFNTAASPNMSAQKLVNTSPKVNTLSAWWLPWIWVL